MLYFIKTASEKLIASGLFAILMIAPAERAGWCQAADTATITVSALNVRSAPSREADRIAVLKKGTLVTVLKNADGWLKISKGDINGYIENNERYVRVEDPDARIEQLKKKAEQIERKIESHRSDLEQFNIEETEIIETLDRIDLSRNDLNRQAAALHRKIDIIRNTIDENQKAAQTLEQEIERTSAQASRRLVALYKLNLLGKLNILGSSDSVYEFLRTKKDMTIICGHDTKILSSHLENKKRLEDIRNRLAAEEMEKASLEKKMRLQIEVMNREKQKRETILTDIREKESARKAALASLEKSAGELDRTIADLYKKAESKKRLKGSFASLKGLLPMPVSGTIITEFGKYRDDNFKIVKFRSGIDIRADRGEPVRAVFRGEVLFAQWFKGYGNMMIIDHGEKYYTVYAHAQELFKKQGDFVETSEVIATVGDTVSLSNETALYFELRHKGKPVDPLAWFHTG